LLQTVRKSGEMLLDLINDVLDYSKIEVGKIEIESMPFDLEAEAETVVRVFEEAARQRGIELRMEVDPALDRMVVGDPMRLRQVVMNLLSNAVKFTPSGSVTLRVGMDDSARDMVRCTVEDTGIGIREKDRVRLFAAFVQADVSTTRKYGGTGLGLAICKRLVEMMGGVISVASTPGKGTTFTFTMRLPRVSEDQRVAMASAAGLRGRPVLLVGDDAERMQLGSRVLEDYLALVLRARSSEELRQAVSGPGKPELIALAPRNDEEAAQHVAALAGSSIPVLLLGGAKLGDGLAFAVRRLPAQVRRGAMLGCLQELCGIADDGSRRSSTQASKSLQKRNAPRVLVADDNEINQRVVEAMLKRLGCEVTIASDGVDAVTQCAARDFDLVLMDYQMPGLDGPEAARRIREYEQQRGKERVAIVALTANAGSDFEQRCESAGMDDFVTKPMQRSDLKRVIDAYANGSRD
jgi:CheY-like chemotaxis protein/anti-sigma regulatory factor (Ser/Thr protein kinase)